MTRPHLALGLAALTLLAGCAGNDVVVSSTRPGKYRLYNCDQLNKRGSEAVMRERELQGLMQKAAQGVGGEIAVALAYRNEYNIVRGDIQEIETEGAEKKCVLKHRSISDQAVR